MIPQKPIKDYQEIARRCMQNIFKPNYDNPYGSQTWDEGSPAHNYYKRWAKRNWKRLSKLTWKQIYKEARSKQ